MVSCDWSKGYAYGNMVSGVGSLAANVLTNRYSMIYAIGTDANNQPLPNCLAKDWVGDGIPVSNIGSACAGIAGVRMYVFNQFLIR
jgi:hypothetical protein